MLSKTSTYALVASLLTYKAFAAPILPISPLEESLQLLKCEDLLLGSAGSMQGKYCLEPLLSDSLLASMTNTPSITTTKRAKIQPRFDSYRTDIDILKDGSKQWCAKPSRGAPQPRQQDVAKLCHNLPDVITVKRNKAVGTDYRNMAICQIFDEGTARYRVCNLDGCSAQVFENNKQNCFRLNGKCPKQGLYSGYNVGKSFEGMGKAMALTGTRMMGDYPFEHNDDNFFMAQFESTCATGTIELTEEEVPGTKATKKLQVEELNKKEGVVETQ